MYLFTYYGWFHASILKWDKIFETSFVKWNQIHTYQKIEFGTLTLSEILSSFLDPKHVLCKKYVLSYTCDAKKCPLNIQTYRGVDFLLDWILCLPTAAGPRNWWSGADSNICRHTAGKPLQRELRNHCQFDTISRENNAERRCEWRRGSLAARC